jgi:hypothetical protein
MIEPFWHRVRGDHQRVIASGDAWILQTFEQPAFVVEDLRQLAVHRDARAHDASAKNLADALMAQAHAEDRQATSEMPDQVHGDPGLIGSARAWRDHQDVGCQIGNRLDRHCIVALDPHGLAELTEILREVPGEGIVVVQ